jgi:adenylate cyclase
MIMGLNPVDKLPPIKKQRTISLRMLMIAGFGGLMALSVGGVLAMSVYANFSNTLVLLNRQAIQLIDGMEQSINRDAAEGERVVRGVARLFEQGDFEIGDNDAVKQILTTLLLSERVVETIAIVGQDHQRFGMARTPQDKIIVAPGPNGRPPPKRSGEPPKRPGEPRPNASADLGANSGANPPARPGPGTGPSPIPPGDEPVWREPALVDGILFHTVAQALKKDGRVEGMVTASVGGHSLNRVVMSIGKDNGTTAFVANSNGEVIAHSHQPQLFQKQSTIPLNEFPDDAIKAFAEGLNDIGEANDENVRIGTAADADGNEYIFISKDITAMSQKPYALTAYFDAAEISSELERVLVSAIIGLVALVLAVTLAILFGNRLSNPLRKIATSASQFANLDLDSYKPLPRSPVREIDEQTNAMNAMHTALSQFGQYVPKELVKRLLHSGTEATRSVEREITVMFTDVAGFTAMSEHMNAGDVVKLLNEHFDLLCEQISANKGTVDKFMGDGLMAFWGAPEADNDHARHALNAAATIASAFDDNNRLRVEKDLKPLKLRIGLHTGRAVIGNIGGADRHNYTVVGDIVNVASRLEQLAKEMIGDRNIIVCCSSECRKAAGNPPHLVTAGSHILRGRVEPISVYVLDLDTDASVAEPENTAREISA